MKDVTRLPALADEAPDPGNEPAGLDEDFATYVATRAMWSDTWTDLEFAPDHVPDTEGLGGYGPDGAHSAGEWLLLGERMATCWAEAFTAMHQPVAGGRAA